MAESDAHTHPALPIRLGVALAHRRARRAMRDERARGRARDAMRAVTGDRLGPDELEALTDAHLVELEARNEFLWRRRAIARTRVEEEHHFLAAVDSRRGVILSFCHFGPAFGLQILMERYGIPLYAVAGGGHFKDKSGPGARRQAQQHRLRRGTQVIEAQGSFAALVSSLREGNVTGLAFDIGGRTPTELFGRTVNLASGASRVATEADALIVPVWRRREGHEIVARFAPAFDPRDHEDAAALHAALAGVHDAWIASDPAAVSLPADLKRQLGLKRPKRAAPEPAAAAAAP